MRSSASASSNGCARAREREDAASRRRLLGGARAEAAAEREALGRAEHVRRAGELHAAPAPPRGERHLLLELRAARRGKPVADRLERRVPRRAALAAKTARAYASASPRRRRRHDLGDPQRGSVSVPVLSRQMTSTEASDSIALSCCASTPRRAMRSAATAKVRLTSRMSPSGTRRHDGRDRGGDRLARGRVRAPRARSRAARPSGITTPTSDEQQAVHDLLERRAGMPEAARLAGDARRVAVRRRPRSPRRRPCPRRRTRRSAARRPARVADGSDSPVRIDSSSSSPAAATSRPSATSWSPGSQAGPGRRRRPPRRGRCARLAVAQDGRGRDDERASRSSARFARTSCVIPIGVFATRTPRKSASCQSPNASVSRRTTARIRLKTVRMFARTMLA